MDEGLEGGSKGRERKRRCEIGREGVEEGMGVEGGRAGEGNERVRE